MLRFKRADLRSFSLTAVLFLIIAMLFSPLKISAPTSQSSNTLIDANYAAKLSDADVVSGENLSFGFGGQDFLELKPVIAIRSANISYRNVTEVVNGSLPEAEGNATTVLRRFVENVSYEYEEFDKRFSSVNKGYKV